VRRLALAIIVGLLSFSASGVLNLVVGEPCAGFSVSAEHDSDCPPTCVTCGCCAQAVEPATIAIASLAAVSIPDLVAVLPAAPKARSHDILHVPKPPSA
jgi:hypothetical protein